MLPPPRSLWCNGCHRKTAHDLKFNERESARSSTAAGVLVTEDRKSLLCCRGCGAWTVQEEQQRQLEDGNGPIDILYRRSPADLWRRAPDWIEQIESMEPTLGEMLQEVYLAANECQPRLLAMGVRSVLDFVMIQIVGDVGTFEQKLDAMVTSGHLAQRQKDMVATVIDAGSASTHRGFRPARSLLEAMMVVMESVVRDHWITNPMLQTLKKQIPPKPPRRTPRDP